ncbi:hypothetical protein GA829_21585 [Mesorhizobium sp. INR15]|nr:hypothetical protein GA829_21585 [Mesorhizobium sp. INR15]
MPRRARPRSRSRIAALILVTAGLALVAAANLHLVYVSFTSQADCVPHLKEPGDTTTNGYAAASSSC